MTERLEDALAVVWERAGTRLAINITSHSGTMQALFRAVHTDDFKPKTGGAWSKRKPSGRLVFLACVPPSLICPFSRFFPACLPPLASPVPARHGPPRHQGHAETWSAREKSRRHVDIHFHLVRDYVTKWGVQAAHGRGLCAGRRSHQLLATTRSYACRVFGEVEKY